MSKTRIKLGSINNLSDARWAAAGNIDFIGFCFDGSSPNFIPPVKAQEIIEWTSGIGVVAEFGPNNTEQEILDITELLNADMVEISSTTNPQIISKLQIPVLVNINISDLNELDIEKKMAEFGNAKAYLFSASNNNYDCNVLVNICQKHPVIWGLPTDKSSIKNILNSFNLYGVNLFAGNEEKTGIKDFDELADMVDLISGHD
ncbi:MAG: hypothetical protein ACK4K9_03920 [Bacteroidia bacterium]